MRPQAEARSRAPAGCASLRRCQHAAAAAADWQDRPGAVRRRGRAAAVGRRDTPLRIPPARQPAPSVRHRTPSWRSPAAVHPPRRAGADGARRQTRTCRSDSGADRSSRIAACCSRARASRPVPRVARGSSPRPAGCRGGRDRLRQSRCSLRACPSRSPAHRPHRHRPRASAAPGGSAVAAARLRSRPPAAAVRSARPARKRATASACLPSSDGCGCGHA